MTATWFSETSPSSPRTTHFRYCLYCRGAEVLLVYCRDREGVTVQQGALLTNSRRLRQAATMVPLQRGT